MGLLKVTKKAAKAKDKFKDMKGVGFDDIMSLFKEASELKEEKTLNI